MLENWQYLWSRCSNAFHLLLISTICAQLSLENKRWPQDIFIKNKLNSSRVIKRCTRFWTQVRILILHLSFMNHCFTLCFNQLQYLHFLSSGRVVNVISSFSYVIFITSICEITYVPRGFRSDDSRMICCQLTPTLYHCATEEYGHVLSFVYIYIYCVIYG